MGYNETPTKGKIMSEPMDQLVALLKTKPGYMLIVPETNNVYLLLPNDKVMYAQIRDLETRTDEEIQEIIGRLLSKAVES